MANIVGAVNRDAVAGDVARLVDELREIVKKDKP